MPLAGPTPKFVAQSTSSSGTPQGPSESHRRELALPGLVLLVFVFVRPNRPQRFDRAPEQAERAFEVLRLTRDAQADPRLALLEQRIVLLGRITHHLRIHAVQGDVALVAIRRGQWLAALGCVEDLDHAFDGERHPSRIGARRGARQWRSPRAHRHDKRRAMSKKKALLAGLGVLLAAGVAVGAYIGPRNVIGMIRYDQRDEGRLSPGDKAPDVELIGLSGRRAGEALGVRRGQTARLDLRQLHVTAVPALGRAPQRDSGSLRGARAFPHGVHQGGPPDR